MSHAFQINPREVLGVTESASLTELRDAFRNKSKKHHPDVGGDEWAFRIVTHAYEVLSTARVMSRADEEIRREAAARDSDAQRASASQAHAAAANPFARVQPRSEASPEGEARRGVHDEVSDPWKRVSVETLLLRYELDGPLGLILGGRPEDRNLSCNLSIQWPSKGLGASGPGDRSATLSAIQDAFRSACRAVPPASATSRAESGQFAGLISYASALQADEAFKVFRAAIREAGYGVAQTIRELTIPRNWQGG